MIINCVTSYLYGTRGKGIFITDGPFLYQHNERPALYDIAVNNDTIALKYP